MVPKLNGLHGLGKRAHEVGEGKWGGGGVGATLKGREGGVALRTVHKGEILRQRKVEFRLGSTEYFCRDQEYDVRTRPPAAV